MVALQAKRYECGIARRNALNQPERSFTFSFINIHIRPR
jgi:hypothetical protein